MFHVIEDAYGILVSKGVYKQVKLYERKGRIYAGYGSGFISLCHRNGTSLSNVRLEEFSIPFKTMRNDVGFLVNPEIYEGKTVAL